MEKSTGVELNIKTQYIDLSQLPAAAYSPYVL